ncbi:MAG: hypothetical protein ABIO05_01505, partial [Ferruginibacter sp.]
AFEHIDLVYRYSKVNVMPPFWYFPDISNSNEYLDIIPGSLENSTITNKEMYQENWQMSAQRFVQLHGHFTNEIPDIGTQKALSVLMTLQKQYGRR